MGLITVRDQRNPPVVRIRLDAAITHNSPLGPTTLTEHVHQLDKEARRQERRARDTADLVHWAETLDNCIGSAYYRKYFAKATALFMAWIPEGENLPTACAEIRMQNGSPTIIQIAGRFNKYVPKIQKKVEALLLTVPNPDTPLVNPTEKGVTPCP